MLQQEFLCRHSSYVALQHLIAIGNSPPSCFVCRDINNLVKTEIMLPLVVNSNCYVAT